jgi:hypothetical protein
MMGEWVEDDLAAWEAEQYAERTSAWTFSREHWFKLPLKLRQRYWRETDYGRKEPSQELLREINAK